MPFAQVIMGGMKEHPLHLATRLRDEAVDGGLKKMREISIVIGDARSFPSARHFGATSDDGKEVILSPRLAEQPPDVINGVVAHELGHAADFLYPARWRPAPDGTRHRWQLWDRRHNYSAWLARHDDNVERDADTIAESMFGTRIFYRGPCRVQSTSDGVRPRPLGLR